jgi:pSer/pThr/pTyr-binding forkhead associated (FHA) protein
MAHLKITDASGRQWQFSFLPQTACTIGRAPDNSVVLDDPRASRYHAHINQLENGVFNIIDGAVINGQLRRSANKVFINGEPSFEHQLKNGDRITIGASTLRFEQPDEERTTDVRYDDKPLGHTQLLISASDVMSTVLRSKEEVATSPQRDKVLETLQRKANILSALYEMSKTLGSVFDLNAIFEKATDIIFRSTPADRVVALLADHDSDEDGNLTPQPARGARAQAFNRSHDHTQSHARSGCVAFAGRGVGRTVCGCRFDRLARREVDNLCAADDGVSCSRRSLCRSSRSVRGV